MLNVMTFFINMAMNHFITPKTLTSNMELAAIRCCFMSQLIWKLWIDLTFLKI